jgi:hypothetical protein
MQLALNIEHFAKPVVTETHRVSFVSNLFGILLKGIKKRLYNDIDNFILAVEGFYPYTEKLELSEATKLLERTKTVISKLNKIDEDLYKTDYLKDTILREKFKYMLKSAYRMESILHKIVYRNIPIEKTDETILKGISGMNRRNMSKLLSV